MYEVPVVTLNAPKDCESPREVRKNGDEAVELAT